MRTTTATGDINSCPIHVRGGVAKDLDADEGEKTPEKDETFSLPERNNEVIENDKVISEENTYQNRYPSIEEISQPRSAEALYNQIMQSSTGERKRYAFHLNVLIFEFALLINTKIRIFQFQGCSIERDASSIESYK